MIEAELEPSLNQKGDLDWSTEFHKLRNDIVISIYHLCKSLVIHDPANDLIKNLMQQFAALLEKLPQDSCRMRLSIESGFFTINDVYLRNDLETITSVLFLKELFGKLRIEGIIFFDPLNPWNCAQFFRDMVQWANSPPRADSFSSAQPNISVKPHDPNRPRDKLVCDATFDEMAYQLVIYFNLQYFFSEHIDKLRKGERAHLGLVKHCLIDLVAISEKNLLSIYALSTIRLHRLTKTNQYIAAVMIAMLMGRFLRLSTADLMELAMACLLYDIGKLIRLPNLDDKGQHLNDEDRKQIQLSYYSSVEGVAASVRNDLSTLKRVLAIFEASGLSQVTEGKRMKPSLFSRIVRIAIDYAALTTAKKYRDAYLPHEALRLMSANFDKKYDPDLFKLFLWLIGLYPPGSVVELSSSELAVVFEPHEKSLSKPSVRLVDPRPDTISPVVALFGSDRSIATPVAPEPLGINPTGYFCEGRKKLEELDYSYDDD